jgi:hypothetical protein
VELGFQGDTTFEEFEGEEFGGLFERGFQSGGKGAVFENGDVTDDLVIGEDWRHQATLLHAVVGERRKEGRFAPFGDEAEVGADVRIVEDAAGGAAMGDGLTAVAIAVLAAWGAGEEMEELVGEGDGVADGGGETIDHGGESAFGESEIDEIVVEVGGPAEGFVLRDQGGDLAWMFERVQDAACLLHRHEVLVI